MLRTTGPRASRRAAAAAPRRRLSRLRSDSGAAAVEFALVAPLLFLLVFGIIDFGLAINARIVAANAAREGARVGSLGGSEAQIRAQVASAASTLPGNTVTVACKTPAGANCTSYATGATSGGTVIVTVTYTYKWITFVGGGFGGDLTINRSSQMRIE